MRLLAPTRRTPSTSAKSGEAKATSNTEVAELRRLIADHTNEYNNEVKRITAIRQENEKIKAGLLADISSLQSEYKAKEAEISNKTAVLEGKVKALEQSADASRYKILNERLESSLKETERERVSLKVAIKSVDESKQSVTAALSEVEEREQVLHDGFESLVDIQKSLELAKNKAELDFINRSKAIEVQEQKAKAKENDILNKESAVDARQRSMDLFEKQLSERSDEISAKERLLADRKAKLDSLISYYERKTR